MTHRRTRFHHRTVVELDDLGYGWGSGLDGDGWGAGTAGLWEGDGRGDDAGFYCANGDGWGDGVEANAGRGFSNPIQVSVYLDPEDQ